MSKIEKKFENPVILGFTYDRQIFDCEEFARSLPVNPGSKIKGEHYGFSIKTADGYETKYAKQRDYRTQGKITAVTTLNGKICIFEEHKLLPWEVTASGKVVKAAKFNPNRAEEVQYLKENFGITTAEEIALVNQEANEELNAKEIKLQKPEPDFTKVNQYFLR